MAVEIKNKKALYRFFLLDEFTAGMELTGSEIKSIRNGKASIVEGYCKMKKGELYIINMYIAEYENGGYANHKPKRERKLLLNRTELSKLERKLKDQGLTVVPIELFISDKGFAKLKVALAKGKKMHDKREDLKDKDIARDMDRKGE